MKLSKKDLHLPFSSLTRDKFSAILYRAVNAQAAAASVVLANGYVPHLAPVPQDMDIQDVWFMSSIAAAASETMTIDIQVKRKAGGAAATILSTPYVFNTTSTPGKQISFLNLVTNRKLYEGDAVAVIRTLANGSTIVHNVVVIEPSISAANPGDN